jgi:hypothetical protein
MIDVVSYEEEIQRPPPSIFYSMSDDALAN